MRSIWSSVIARRGSSCACHSGTATGAAISARPSFTTRPTRAWVMLLATDQEGSVSVAAMSAP
ncbi:MAG: hypothetical protein WDM81_06925 [Rhizomicrobium sp.]